MPANKITLIAAMDWGLGHATRLVPIIRERERNGEKIILASAGKAFDFWMIYFPHLKILKKPGYKIQYPENGSMKVDFYEHVKGIAPGQSAVFYEGDDVIGGGVIQR